MGLDGRLASQHHGHDHPGGKQPGDRLDVFAEEQRRKSDGEEDLQQLDLTDPGNTAHRQPGVPGKETDELREQRDVTEGPPGLGRNLALMLQRQVHHRPDQQRRRQHQRPADHLPTAHLLGQSAALGVPQTAHGNRAEHQQVTGLNAAGPADQRITQH